MNCILKQIYNLKFHFQFLYIAENQNSQGTAPQKEKTFASFNFSVNASNNTFIQ